jgi:hypothetical protein
VKITIVEYRRVKHLSKVESELLGATAEVGAEGPEAALEGLRDWVDGQLGDAEEARALRTNIRDLTWQKEGLERQVALVERRWSAIQGFLTKLGIERPSEIPETLEHIPDGSLR